MSTTTTTPSPADRQAEHSAALALVAGLRQRLARLAEDLAELEPARADGVTLARHLTAALQAVARAQRSAGGALAWQRDDRRRKAEAERREGRVPCGP